MKSKRVFSSTRLLALLSLMTFGTVMWAVTGIQVGPSGMTYASAEVQCAVNPITGMAPMVQAGLYNPKKSISFLRIRLVSRQRLVVGRSGLATGAEESTGASK